MVDSIFSLFNTVATSVTGWFTQLWSSTGMGYVYLGGLLLYTFVRFVFLPMIGRKMGSDFARSSSKKDDTSSSKELTVVK